MNAFDLYQSWRAGKVVRMHTAPQQHRENIAEHTWGVIYLLIRYFPDCSKDLLVAAHAHDTGEQATGDMPGHVKWADKDFGEKLGLMEQEHIAKLGYPVISLSQEEEYLLEILDKTEFAVSCLHELRLGNKNAATYYNRSVDRINELSANPSLPIDMRWPLERMRHDLNLCASRADIGLIRPVGERFSGSYLYSIKEYP
jgi:5'-deoxynucleotidase YfbR-like HD superfamily hydrolase